MPPKPLLICTVGLPRSGKSTWAKKRNAPIVNPDSVRLALHGQRYASPAEPMVWVIAMYMVKALFLAGHRCVIVDATNTTRKRRDFWQDEGWVTNFHVIDTPEAECIERVPLRDDAIIPVIERMARGREPLNPDEERYEE